METGGLLVPICLQEGPSVSFLSVPVGLPRTPCFVPFPCPAHAQLRGFPKKALWHGRPFCDFQHTLECLHNIVPKVSLATRGNIYCPFAEDPASFVEAKRPWPPACVPGTRIHRIAELGETKPMPGPFKRSAALSFPTHPLPFVLSCPEAGNNPNLPNLPGVDPG